MRHKEWKMGTMVERIQPVGPSNLLNNMVKVFANAGNTLPPGNLRTFRVRHESTTQQSVDSKIVPVSSIAAGGWGPKKGGNATSPLHSRGSPTKGTKLEVKTYAGGHHDAPRNKAWIQRLSRFPQ